MDLNIGDVVKLKSGGPKMTVTSFDQPYGSNIRQCRCTWFKSENEAMDKFFPIESLEKVKSS